MKPALHPNPDQLSAYLLGNLAWSEVEKVEAHLDSCAACRSRVEVLDRGDDSFVSCLRGAAVALGEDPALAKLVAAARVVALATDSRVALSTQGDVATPPRDIELTFLAPPQQPDELGRLGIYRILKILGRGGMGIVFLAEDPTLRRFVALKVMQPQLAADHHARGRFLREARAMAALKNDQIVTVYHVDQQGKVPFLAMECLEGETLQARAEREKCLPIWEVLRIGREIAVGLDAAHARKLIHRDIKPANLWLERSSERVKILDFGLAREMDAQLTGHGVILGTPTYMAPEQARGEVVDQRSDLYSLGAVLYRLCTGKPPFQGKDTMAVLTALAVDQPQAPQELNLQVSPALNDLILRLLSKKPADRPSSASVVSRDLQAIAALVPTGGAATRTSRVSTDSSTASYLPNAAPIAPTTIETKRSLFRGGATLVFGAFRFGCSFAIAATILVVGGYFLVNQLNVQLPKPEEVVDRGDQNKGKDLNKDKAIKKDAPIQEVVNKMLVDEKFDKIANGQALPDGWTGDGFRKASDKGLACLEVGKETGYHEVTLPPLTLSGNFYIEAKYIMDQPSGAIYHKLTILLETRKGNAPLRVEVDWAGKVFVPNDVFLPPQNYKPLLLTSFRLTRKANMLTVILNDDVVGTMNLKEDAEYNTLKLGLTAGTGYTGRLARLYHLKISTLDP